MDDEERYKFGYDESHLLAIGISHYEADTLEIPYAVKDAERVATALKSPFGFANPRILRNKQATRAAILREMYQLRDSTQANDRAVIFFSGHGVFEKFG